MEFLIYVLNVVSAFVPDFLRLPLVAAEFVGLYSIAKTCGLSPRTDLKFAAERKRRYQSREELLATHP